jgi:hypothetical protein
MKCWSVGALEHRNFHCFARSAQVGRRCPQRAANGLRLTALENFTRAGIPTPGALRTASPYLGHFKKFVPCATAPSQ